MKHSPPYRATPKTATRCALLLQDTRNETGAASSDGVDHRPGAHDRPSLSGACKATRYVLSLAVD